MHSGDSGSEAGPQLQGLQLAGAPDETESLQQHGVQQAAGRQRRRLAQTERRSAAAAGLADEFKGHIEALFW